MKTLLTLSELLMLSRIDYGAYELELLDNQLLIDTDALPTDFSTDTYTIIDGELVKASAELLAERLAAQRVADREAIRAERERRYQSEAIASLYWTWIESGVEADRTAWIAAKEAVRLELPYPETQEGGVQ